MTHHHTPVTAALDTLKNWPHPTIKIGGLYFKRDGLYADLSGTIAKLSMEKALDSGRTLNALERLGLQMFMAAVEKRTRVVYHRGW